MPKSDNRAARRIFARALQGRIGRALGDACRGDLENCHIQVVVHVYFRGVHVGMAVKLTCTEDGERPATWAFVTIHPLSRSTRNPAPFDVPLTSCSKGRDRGDYFDGVEIGFRDNFVCEGGAGVNDKIESY